MWGHLGDQHGVGHGLDGRCCFVTCVGIVIVDVVDTEMELMLLVREDVDKFRWPCL